MRKRRKPKNKQKMSLDLPPITASFATRMRYIKETRGELLQNMCELRAHVLSPPPHHWTTVTLWEKALLVFMRDLRDLRQFVAILSEEEAQILEEQGTNEYPTQAERVDAIKTCKAEFKDLRLIKNKLDQEVRVMTVVGEFVTWNLGNRGRGTLAQLWDWVEERLLADQENIDINLDDRAIEYVMCLLPARPT
ncbi:hypothetical protein RUND412_001963 [Rhizina undulata]